MAPLKGWSVWSKGNFHCKRSDFRIGRCIKIKMIKKICLKYCLHSLREDELFCLSKKVTNVQHTYISKINKFCSL